MSLLVPLDIGLSMGLILAWAVLAFALAYRLLDFPDLTVEGSLPLGAAVFSVLHKGGMSISMAMLMAVSTAAAAGCLTGLLHVCFKMNKFLAGILVVAITYSLSLRIMSASNIGLLQSTSIFDFVVPLDKAGPNKLHTGTNCLLTGFIAIGAVTLPWALASQYGLRLRTAGSNPEHAKALGINVPLNIMIGLAVTNALAGFAGILLSMHQGFADISMGQGTLILALAALSIGERLLPERHFPFHAYTLWAAICGSVVYQILLAYAVRAGLAPTDLKLATAILVLVVVALRMSRGHEALVGGNG